MQKEEKIAIVRQMMSNHPVLPVELFDANGKVYPGIREKLLKISDYMLEWFLPAFPQMKVLDVFLSGSMCSYIYNETSDLDLFVAVDDIVPQDENLSKKLLSNLNSYVFSLKAKPEFYKHPIDYGALLKNDLRFLIANRYSLMKDKWMIKLQRQEFSYTPEELFAAYCKFSADFHQYVNNLPKVEGAFLTYESANELRAKISELGYNACILKETSPEREYNMQYNIYRLFKRFGVYSHFNNYIAESLKKAG